MRDRNVFGRVLLCVRWLLGVLILASVVINFANIIARYVFLSPLFWAEAVITYILIWCVFLGAALATWDDRHIRVDLVSATAPEWFRRVLNILVLLFTLGLAGVVAAQSLTVTQMMVRTGQRTAVEGLPLTIPHSALLVGFSLMAIAAVVRLVELLRGAKDGDESGFGDGSSPPSPKYFRGKWK